MAQNQFDTVKEKEMTEWKSGPVMVLPQTGQQYEFFKLVGTSNIPLINYNVRYQIYSTKKGVHTLCYVNTVLIVENMTVVFAAHVK